VDGAGLFHLNDLEADLPLIYLSVNLPCLLNGRFVVGILKCGSHSPIHAHLKIPVRRLDPPGIRSCGTIGVNIFKTIHLVKPAAPATVERIFMVSEPVIEGPKEGRRISFAYIGLGLQGTQWTMVVFHFIFDKPLYYWTSRSDAEVDFLLGSGQQIFPLEVKSGISRNTKSLQRYDSKY
jgi:hypothetical protein